MADDGARGPSTDPRRRIVPTRGRRVARPTPFGWVALATAGALYLAGSNIGSGWVVLVTSAVAAAVLVDVVTATRTARRTLVTGHVAGAAGAGAPVALHLRVERPDTAPPSHLVVLGAAAVLRGPAAVEAPVVLRRGRWTAVEVGCRTVGAMGLAAVAHPAVVAVDRWSRPAALPAADRTRRLTSGGIGSGGARRGADLDLGGIRPYQPGDQRRAVHWRATARLGSLVVREPATGDGQRLRLAIEGGLWPQDALDLAASVVASIAVAAEQDGHVVEVAADGRVAAGAAEAADLLAALPPAAGLPARPLAPPSAAADPTALLTVAPAPPVDDRSHPPGGADRSSTAAEAAVEVHVAGRPPTRLADAGAAAGWLAGGGEVTAWPAG